MANKQNEESKRKWKRVKRTIKIVILLLILLWLLREWEINQTNIHIIQQYMNLTTQSISELNDSVQSLQSTTDAIIVKINGIQSHLVTQDNIIKELTNNQKQLHELDRQLQSFMNNMPEVKTETPNTSMLTHVGNAAGWFSVVVGGLEIVRRVIMSIPPIIP